MTTYGIDVSKWQDPFDWTKVYAQGNRFMFARASLGLIADPKYAAHVPNARRAGLVAGAYHYLWPNVDPAKAVQLLLHVVGPTAGVPIALDVEESGVTWPMVKAWAAEFRKQLPGHPLGIYISPGFLSRIGNPTLAGVFDYLWLAYWPSGGYPGDGSSVWNTKRGGLLPGIWQYGGRVADGQNVDGNAFVGSIDTFKSRFASGSLPDTSTSGASMGLYKFTQVAGTFNVIGGQPVHGLVPTDTGWSVSKTWTPGGDYDYGYDGRLDRMSSGITPSHLVHVVGGPLDGLYVSTAEIANGVDAPAPPAPADTTPFGQADIDAAKAAGYADGLAAGESEGADAERTRLRTILGL